MASAAARGSDGIRAKHDGDVAIFAHRERPTALGPAGASKVGQRGAALISHLAKKAAEHCVLRPAGLKNYSL